MVVLHVPLESISLLAPYFPGGTSPLFKRTQKGRESELLPKIVSLMLSETLKAFGMKN